MMIWLPMQEQPTSSQPTGFYTTATVMEPKTRKTSPADSAAIATVMVDRTNVISRAFRMIVTATTFPTNVKKTVTETVFQMSAISIPDFLRTSTTTIFPTNVIQLA